eukprot:jgi/Botrbrau1/19094/Bobra.0077s0008.1
MVQLWRLTLFCLIGLLTTRTSEAAKFALSQLPYPTNGLEPYIDNQTVYLHHFKHQQGYVDNLNKFLDSNPALQGFTLSELITDQLSSTTAAPAKAALRNQAGGDFNHIIYFSTLKPNGSQPSERMLGLINSHFGSFDAFKQLLSSTAAGVFGSGWGWLAVNPATGSLSVQPSNNQDNPVMTGLGYTGDIPILGVDVWEHSYYLKYQNRRADYITAWFNVIDWDRVEKNYDAAVKKDLAALLGA